MRYDDFIAEVRELISEAEFVHVLSVDHQDGSFREWRHKAESLVAEATAQGYRLPGPFKSASRSYMARWSGATQSDDVKALEKDLRDSMIELRYLVSSFEKFGPPALQLAVTQASSLAAVELAVPERVTVVWLARHVPIGLWLTAGGILVAAFLLGAAAGQTGAGRAIVAAVKAVIPGH